MKKIATFSLLISFVLINSMAVYAETDNAIDYVLDYQLMDAFREDVFAPYGQVSGLEALTVLYRVIESTGGVDADKLEEWKTEYQPVFQGLEIPETLAPFSYALHDSVAYALGTGAVTENSLEALMEGSLLKRIDKETLASLMGKMLNYYLDETLNSIIALTYKDDGTISVESRRYIMFLVEEGILTGKGDQLGNFNPQTIVTRDLMATLTKAYHQRFMDLFSTYPVEYPPSQILVSGRLTGIHIKEVTELTIVDSSDTVRRFSVSDSVVYETSLRDLKLNEEVQLTVTRQGIEKVERLPRILVEQIGVELQVTDVYEATNLLMGLDASGNRRILAFLKEDSLKARDYPVGSWVYVQGEKLNNLLYEVHQITLIIR